MPEAVEDVAGTLLASALRGSAATPPRAVWPELLASADREGVLPLLADAAASASWDAELIAAMRPSVMAEAALAILRERELRILLDALREEDVLPLLLKGAHLAYAVYPSPDRRPRLDTDLLIKDVDRDAVRRCLLRLGYSPAAKVTGEVAFAQFQYWRTDRSGATHTVDVHWRVANPKAFADRVTYDELRQTAVAVPRLGANAFAPAAPLALLIACLHRTAHHATAPRLLWLYDMHLLAAQFTQDDWDRLVLVAEARGLSLVVAAGLADAIDRLGTIVPNPVLERLQSGAGATDRDVLAFLNGPQPQIQVAVSDWNRIRGWRSRARFLREHLFPPASYVRQRYKNRSTMLLPLLYAHRIASGSVKWFRRPQ